MTGLHLAQYRIDAELGRGGMGVVYRATDTKLNRKVALKVLPASALGSAEDRARFFREAQAAAQLSHPNVCHVYQVDEAVPLDAHGNRVTGQDDARLFIAMEFIEGETLEEVIRKGPLKLADAVHITSMVAEALRAAHAKEIVHRDIKSANVMLTADGVAKVLDFGLAKTNASTMLTRQGSTLGTVAYMSPEQARGEPVDRRSDLWSLGIVIHEMVAGRLPFAADYEQAALYGILNEDPEPLSALRAGVPANLEWITDKLLQKEPSRRYQTAEDLLVDLRALELDGQSTRSSRRTTARMPARRPPGRTWHMVGAVGVLGLLVVAVLLWLTRPQAPRDRRAFDRPMPGLTAAAISPAGDRYAYVERDTLYVRDLADVVPRALTPTTAGFLAWSPDGADIAYAEGGQLWRVNASVGRPGQLAVVESGTIFGLVWKPSGEVVVSVRSGTGLGDLMSVPASGGRLEVIRRSSREADESSFGDLAIAPDGTTLIAAVITGEQLGSVRALPEGESRVLVDLRELTTYEIAVTPDGDLLVARSDGLWKYRLADDYLSTVGDPERVAPPGTIQPGVGSDGTYLYIQTDPVRYRSGWWDETAGEGASFGRAAPSIGGMVVHPDENRIVTYNGQGSLWIEDDRGSATPVDTRYDRLDVPFDWMPDGRRVVFGSWRGGGLDLYVMDVASGAAPQALTVGESAWASSLASSGMLAYYRITEEHRRDLYMKQLDIRADTVLLGEARLYLRTPFNEAMPSVHPSADYLAYQSDMSGRWEIYVRSFPDPDESFWPVTVDGGLSPKWDPTGRWLYFQGLDDVLYRVSFDASQANPVGEVERLFPLVVPEVNPYTRRYAIGPTSGRILTYFRTRKPGPPMLTIVQNP